MDLKVTNLAQIQQQNALSNLPETDGSFRFALLSNLQENELQSQLAFMMEEITQQGNRISKRMDVRDMKQYRKLIKEFINEILHIPINSVVKIFLTVKAGIVYMELSSRSTRH